jgi:hypothetical protein
LNPTRPTTDAADDDIKVLSLGLRKHDTLEIRCGGLTCWITLEAYHGSNASLTVEAPLAFTFVRGNAKAKHLKGVRR